MWIHRFTAQIMKLQIINDTIKSVYCICIFSFIMLYSLTCIFIFKYALYYSNTMVLRCVITVLYTTVLVQCSSTVLHSNITTVTMQHSSRL